MWIKWFGTASILVGEYNHNILFDPYLSMNKKLYRPCLDEFAQSDNIFISHGHFDHLISVPDVLGRGKATVYCSGTAANTLMREGINSNRIAVIAPGDSLTMGPFKINVLKGKHIVFDRKLVAKTLINPRVLIHFGNFRKILKESSRYPEGQTLVFNIETKDKKILHMGSLNLDETENYPGETDILTLPFQGRSDLDHYALQFVQRFKPKSVYLHHFDDTFPPVSSAVDIQSFISKVRVLFPDIKMIVPKHGELITI